MGTEELGWIGKESRWKKKKESLLVIGGGGRRKFRGDQRGLEGDACSHEG